MSAETLEIIRVSAYFIITVLLVVFLYSYAISMYRKQKNGTRDYEKYGELAVNDDLNDELIEPRIKQTKGVK